MSMLPTSPSHFLMIATNDGLLVPPLDEERFNGSFKHFCSAKRLVLDRELLHLRGRRVNLHFLHKEVMEHRGYNIHQRGSDFWVKIGARLGFIHSQDVQSTSTEVADRLATIYKWYLGEFDTIYVMSFVQELQQRTAHARLIG